MTTEKLRKLHRAIPFIPFTIRMADGRQFEVPHPDFLSISPPDRIACIFDPDGAASIVDLLLMTELQLAAPAPSRA